MKDGTQYSGIISSKTETDIEIKMPGLCPGIFISGCWLLATSH